MYLSGLKLDVGRATFLLDALKGKSVSFLFQLLRLHVPHGLGLISYIFKDSGFFSLGITLDLLGLPFLL